MRYFDRPKFRGLILRRTTEELRELKAHARILYGDAYPKAKFKEIESTWVFPSGATLWMSYLDREEDAERYRGLTYSWIGFDELTQWPTPHAWNFLLTRLRSDDPFLSQNLSMRATTNPGGPGHGWVKKMFIDPAPHGQAFWATNIDTEEVMKYPKEYRDDYLADQPLFKRRFIPAKLIDNPYLYADGNYERNLMGQSENQRRQLLDGDWDVAEGAAFSEFRAHIHTCEPSSVTIQNNWRRFRSCDWGYSTRQQTAVHWFAIAPDDTLYVYRELITNQKTARELALEIREIERDENISYGILDASAWAQRGQSAPSIAEEMIKAGCRWRPSDRMKDSRKHGANRFHEVLRVRPDTGKPGIIFFNTCRKIISTLPILPQDPDGSDDIDDKFHDDHAYDSVRYGIMSRPKYATPWENSNNIQKKFYRPVDTVFGY